MGVYLAKGRNISSNTQKNDNDNAILKISNQRLQISNTLAVGSTATQLCKLRDTSGSFVLYFIYECVLSQFRCICTSTDVWTYTWQITTCAY